MRLGRAKTNVEELARRHVEELAKISRLHRAHHRLPRVSGAPAVSPQALPSSPTTRLTHSPKQLPRSSLPVHEVAHHSYAHIDPSIQTTGEERRDLVQALEALHRIGVEPLGYCSPSAVVSTSTLALLDQPGSAICLTWRSHDFIVP